MSKEKLQIKEEDKLHEQWFLEAREQTLETLPDFLKHLTEDYGHDYGTICHAVTAAAIGAANAVNHSPEGGITGFQAGCIMWGFIKQWLHNDNKCGLKLINFDDFLYPQYENHFEKTISKERWESIQREAQNHIENREQAAEHVIKHWKNIVDGKIPFGFTIKNEE